MAISITLTLGAGLGTDLGPNFNLTADVGSVTPSTATKSELTAGKIVSVDDLATQITVTSTGTCTNTITQTIPCAGGTTTTTTSTTTAAPTTTTTTAAPTCFYAVVTSTDPTYGASISATLCDGSSYTDNGMFGTQTICVQSISVSGGDYTNGGACSVETTTSTSTSTTTTTAASTNFLISDGYGAGSACSGLGGPYPNSVYAASSVWYDPGGPYVTRFFTDSSMTVGFAGGDLYYGDQYATFGTTLQIDNNGYVIGYYSC